MPRRIGGPRAPQSAREENAQHIQGQRGLDSYYCARCRTLRPEGELDDDPALGYVCKGGC